MMSPIPLPLKKVKGQIPKTYHAFYYGLSQHLTSGEKDSLSNISDDEL